MARKLDSKTIERAAYGNDAALVLVAGAATRYLDRTAGNVTASALMREIADTADHKALGSALYWARAKLPDFAPYWKRGTKKTVGGNLRIEYIGQKF